MCIYTCAPDRDHIASLKQKQAPENRPSQRGTSIPTFHSQVLCEFQGGYMVHPFCFVSFSMSFMSFMTIFKVSNDPSHVFTSVSNGT